MQECTPTVEGNMLVYKTSTGITYAPLRLNPNYNTEAKSAKSAKKTKIQSSKNKRVTWSSEEIEFMLNIFKDKNILKVMDGNKYRSLEIYRSVVDDMSKANFIRTAEQIRTKMRLLRASYFKCKKHLNTSGVGGEVFEQSDGEEMIREDCDFYDLLKDIYGSRPSANANMNGLESSEYSSGISIEIEGNFLNYFNPHFFIIKHKGNFVGIF